MIQPIFWSNPKLGEPPSPFLRGKIDRPLKLVFHSSSFSNPTEEETEAIKVLFEFSHLPEIVALDTSISDLPHLEINTLWETGYHLQILINSTKIHRRALLPFDDSLKNLAVRLSGKDDLSQPDVIEMYKDICLAIASFHLGYDILVTLSNRLLEHKNDIGLQKVNLLKPTEAVKIVGWFLRSRGNFTTHVDGYASFGFDKGLFYWVLARSKLPAMWKYFSICVDAEDFRHDNTLTLGQSVLERCARALQARDAIATQFFIPQDNNTRDTMMYHFDYLTLLLSGAIDAQAIIAHRAYRFQPNKEKNASFQREEFQRFLKMETMAADLYNFFSDQRYKDLSTLLYEIRNTIHREGLTTAGYQSTYKPERSFVTILPKNAKPILEAALRCGPMELWGLRNEYNLIFEPFTYASKLIVECFSVINSIAEKTNLQGLFPKEFASTPPKIEPQTHDVFNEKNNKRVSILGW